MELVKFCTVGLFILFFMPLQLFAASRHSQSELRDDLRFLANLLEENHPDPYIRGGGKIAFHRHLHQLLANIPPKGMSKSAFYAHISPFVARVKDGHTKVLPINDNNLARGHLPIRLSVVSKGLYISAVASERLQGLIGARLESVEKLTYSQLLKMLENIAGFDNEYHALDTLAEKLTSRRGLLSINETRFNKSCLEFSFSKDSRTLPLKLYFRTKKARTWIKAKTKSTLPAHQKSDFAYRFIDGKKDVALLSLRSMMGYREQFEYYRSVGSNWQSAAKRAYERHHNREAPKAAAAALPQVPAISEVFTSLANEMKSNSTRLLVVDLRRNRGGFSLATMLFLHVFAGVEHFAAMKSGYQINRYSKLYFENNKRIELAKLNTGRKVPLSLGDYDFSQESAFRLKSSSSQNLLARIEKLVPTYKKLMSKAGNGPIYRPPLIVALTSAKTYSAGFDLALAIKRLGGKLVGVPSAQAGNCFINSLSWKLPNTKLCGTLSSKFSVAFPEAKKEGRVLRPDREVTYNDLRSYAFDPNTALRIVLDEM